jgi:hypothetical protein
MVLGSVCLFLCVCMYVCIFSLCMYSEILNLGLNMYTYGAGLSVCCFMLSCMHACVYACVNTYTHVHTYIHTYILQWLVLALCGEVLILSCLSIGMLRNVGFLSFIGVLFQEVRAAEDIYIYIYIYI